MLRLFGSSVPHEFGFVVRYAQSNTTDVLYTTGHPDFIIEEYRSTFHYVDPFGTFWRKTHRKGLITSGDAVDATPETRLYTDVFQKRAKIVDEIGIVLPFPGKSCIALFLERSATRFSPLQSDQISQLYPALEGLQFAHLARLFGKITGMTADLESAVMPPTMIIDRRGHAIYRNSSWREAESVAPRLSQIRWDFRTASRTSEPISESMTLKVAALPDDFSIAPGGKLCILKWDASERLAPGAINPADQALLPLTKLEHDILSQILRTKSSREIAMALGIAKGTVKNYKQRLYRKFSVNSERELLGLLAKVKG
jgi:DNA-binding CsgD family transcriptional regulator